MYPLDFWFYICSLTFTELILQSCTSLDWFLCECNIKEKWKVGVIKSVSGKKVRRRILKKLKTQFSYLFKLSFLSLWTFIVNCSTFGTKLVSNTKCVRIRSYSGPYFPATGLNTERYGAQMRENTDQNNPKYGHFSRREK